MRSLFPVLALFFWQLSSARAENVDESAWVEATAGARLGSFQEQVGSTSVKVTVLELPRAQVAAEKAIRLWGKKALWRLQAGGGQADFRQVSTSNLPASNLFLYDFDGELKTSLRDQGRSSTFVGPVFLLGARYAAQPALWRPASATGKFAYSRVPTLYGNLGLGFACLFSRSTARVYLRAGLPLYMGGDVSAGGGVALSVSPEYLFSVGRQSSLSFAVPVAYSNLHFQHLDAYTNQSLRHEVTMTTASLLTSYIYRF